MFYPTPYWLSFVVLGVIGFQIVTFVWLLALSIRAWRYMGEQRKMLQNINAILYKHFIAKP